MTTYKLTYARVLYLERLIEADDIEQAYTKASELEDSLELGIASGEGTIESPIIIAEGSTLSSIDDYEVVWEVEEA